MGILRVRLGFGGILDFHNGESDMFSIQAPTWEFPKIVDPNAVPRLVEALSYGPQNEVPLIFGNSHMVTLT